jgi:hypothetical protein
LPNGAGHVPAGEPEPPQLVVWHEFLDQRKELTLLKPGEGGVFAAYSSYR